MDADLDERSSTVGQKDEELHQGACADHEPTSSECERLSYVLRSPVSDRRWREHHLFFEGSAKLSVVCGVEALEQIAGYHEDVLRAPRSAYTDVKVRLVAEDCFLFPEQLLVTRRAHPFDYKRLAPLSRDIQSKRRELFGHNSTKHA